MSCVLLFLGCGASSGPPAGAVAHDGGRMLNPKLADGTPVMMGFDSHHPSCFTFPSEGKDSEKVTCPENALGILNDCRGSKLYLAKSETGCVCVPVSGDAPSEMACPDGIETER